MAKPTEAQRAEYIRLREGGMSKEDALAKVRAMDGQAQPAAPKADRPPEAESAVPWQESAARGAAQGVTMGFADEITGAAKALGVTPQKLAMAFMGGNAIGEIGSYLTRRLGKTVAEKGTEGALESYRQERDESRAAYDAAEKANPKTYLAGQIGGGLATAVLPGGGAATLGKVVKAGAAYGAGAGAGESRADLTKGEVGDLVVDATKGGAIGVVGGALGRGVAKAAGAAASGAQKAWSNLPESVPGATRAADAVARKQAEKVAKEVAKGSDELSQIGHAQPVSSFHQRSMEREKAISETIGEKFQFKAGQATGSRRAALADRTAEQMASTMDAAQAQTVKQTRQYARYLDMKVDGLAAKPEMLGRADVGNQLAGDIQRYTEGLVSERAETARKLFGAVDEIAGNQKIVPVKNTVNAIMRLAEEKRSPLAAGSSKAALAELEALGEQLAKAGDGAPIDAMLSASEFQRALSDWGKKAASSGDIFKDVERGEGQRMAREIFKGLQQDLEDAAGEMATSRLGAAGQALVRARDVYKAMSREIEEAGTEAVKRILKVGATDATDTITTRMLSSSPEQISGVFRVLNRAAPDSAQQLRAQLLDDLLAKAGKTIKGAEGVAEVGADKFQAGTALHLLTGDGGANYARLNAAFTGDTKAQLALREIVEDLQRLSFGPGIKGSDTVPKGAMLLDLAAKNLPGGEAARDVAAAVQRIARSDAAAARVVTTPEGLDAINQALRGVTGRSKLSEKAALAIMATFTRLGINTTDIGEAEPAPTGARKGSTQWAGTQ